MIWLSSDLHFGHDREFIYKPRGFNSVDEMNEAIVERFNKLVRPGDDLYLLGDLCLGDPEKAMEYLNKLNGRKYIIYGNHDTDRRKSMFWKLDNVANCADALSFKYGKYHFYLSHYPTITGNLQNENLAKMMLNLYGHTHQTSNFFHDLPYCYHVGVDSHGCYPVDLDMIIRDMEAKIEECKNIL